jgi:hypothetical protein
MYGWADLRTLKEELARRTYPLSKGSPFGRK